MDAVKFMQEYNKICKTHNKCEDCPLYEVNCFNPVEDPREESEYSELVEAVERWSEEHEVVGKKYIIEIDAVDKSNHHNCHTSIGWFSKSQLEQLEEYNESEE